MKDTLPDGRVSAFDQKPQIKMAEAEGLEPPSPFGRRFSRPLTYQLAYASANLSGEFEI
jgi:hypothetical protein